MVQTFEETTHKKLSLYNFVNHYKFDINDIYKKDVSFYRLLTEAGIKNFREKSSIENAIVGRLKNLLTINSPKFINYIKSILNSDNVIHNELLDRMTYYSLFNKTPEKEGFINIIEALDFVKNSECLNYEINEICNCPNCDGKIVEKKSKRGKIFYGCNNYPKCKTAYWDMPIGEACPKCGKMLVTKKDKVKCSECDYEK